MTRTQARRLQQFVAAQEDASTFARQLGLPTDGTAWQVASRAIAKLREMGTESEAPVAAEEEPELLIV